MALRTEGDRYEGKTDPDRKVRASYVWRHKNPSHHLYQRSRQNARQRGIPFELMQTDVDELLDGMTCALSGLQLRWHGRKHDPWAPSLDRLDSSRGYVVGNVRIVCWLVNRAKHAGTDADLLKLAEALVGKFDG